MRVLAGRLHRWAGLATALFLAAAGLTGSVLAFKNELEALLNPQLFQVAVPHGSDTVRSLQDPFVLREQLQQRYPAARADYLGFPQPGHSLMFFLMPRPHAISGDPIVPTRDQVFVDPYTGAVLGDRQWGVLWSEGRWHAENLVPFVWRLHEALALPHPWGKWFMGAVALVWTLDCFTGLWLTLPRGQPFLRKWRPAWGIKRGASAYRFTLDLHRAFGLWLWVALLVFAWSSVMLNLREAVYRPVMSTAFSFQDEARQRPPRLPSPRWEPGLDWRVAHARARDSLQSLASSQGFQVLREDSLWYRPAQGAYLYRTRTSWDLRDEVGRSDLWIDGDTGAVLLTNFEGRGLGGDQVSAWLRVLHTGEIGGLAYRIAVGLVGVVVAMLSVTGIMVWARKRRARAHGCSD